MQGQAPRILVRAVNWLGDAVMTTPALQRLREARPNSHITLLTHEKLADLWRDHPSIDSVLTFAAAESVWSIARRLKQHQFDTAVIFPNSPRSALETWLARIPQRIGYAREWRNWFLTQAVPSREAHAVMRKHSASDIKRLIYNSEGAKRKKPFARESHQIHEYLSLVAALGANANPVPPHVQVAAGELDTVASHFGLKANAGESFYGLNPGAEYGPAKRWPADRFTSAAVEIRRQTGCRWLIFGGAADVTIANQIEAGIQNALPKSSNSVPPINLAGKTNLRQLCALLKLCRVVLTNDSGPMHVAAAVGTPVVVPFGSTSPDLTGPGLPGEARHQLLAAHPLCSPCFLRECPIDFRCMTGISVEQVVGAVLHART